MTDRRAVPAQGGVVAGGLLGLAVAIAAAFAEPREGMVAKARPDPAGIPTYCFGETEKVDPSRIYTRSECSVLLRKRLALDYAPKILACLPQLERSDRVNAFGAFLDASYNAGPVAVCQSRMAAAVRADNLAAACAGFRGWYVTARDRRTGKRILLNGLVSRREGEAALCGKDVR
jgi:lysozyme